MVLVAEAVELNVGGLAMALQGLDDWKASLKPGTRRSSRCEQEFVTWHRHYVST